MQPGVSAKTSRWRSGWIANLLLLLCSLAVGLALCEVAVRLFAPQPINGIFLDFAPRGYAVTKSKGAVRFSVGENQGVYRFVSPHLRGLHPPPRGAARILALGDSFTFGQGLTDKDTYVERLQDKLDATFGAGQIALLNAAISGSGTAQHLAFLEDFGDEIAPAAVFVFVSIDDFNRAQRSPLYRLRDANTLDLDAGTEPVNALKRIIVTSDTYNFVIEHLQLAQLIRRAHLWFLSAYGSRSATQYPEHAQSNRTAGIFVGSAHGAQSETGPSGPIIDGSPEQQRLARALFRRMKAWCDARGIKLAVIDNGWRAYPWLADMLASEQILAFDAAPQVLPVILRDRASYVIAGDGHPNAAGDALTADAVWPFVREFVKRNNLEAKR